MKVIFLDFDGVINENANSDDFVNPLFVNEIKKIMDKTDAKIVVTSNKRKEKSFCYQKYIKPLLQMGVEIYDYTPFVNGKLEETRELEIESYLKNHPEIQEFVIIEDDYVMQRLYDHQVFIEYSNGFVSEYIDPTLRILNGNLGFYPPEYDRSETFEERIRRLFPNLFLDPVLEKNLEDIENRIFGLDSKKIVKKRKKNASN